VLQTTVSAQGNITNQANQTLYSIWGLPAGPHTITITKRGDTWTYSSCRRQGTYMWLDGFTTAR
jgi:hypothetical protein